MANMNRRKFLGAFGAGIFAAKEGLAQGKQEDSSKPENKNETYKKILEQTTEAEKKLADLEKKDFEAAKAKVEEAGRTIDNWHSDTFEQALQAEFPKNLPANKEQAVNELRAFSKQLEALGEKLRSEFKTFEKTNPDENPENEKINRGLLGLVSAYNEVAKFVDSGEFKELREAEQKQLTDWKAAIRPKLIALRDAIAPFQNVYDQTSEKFENQIQKINDTRLKLEDINLEALNKIIEISQGSIK